MSHANAAVALVAAIVGDHAEELLAALDLDRAFTFNHDLLQVSRIGFAAALNAVLFDRLLARVPTGRRFVADQRARGERIVFDHGALRSIRFASGKTGELPAGENALTRILQPLGYRLGGVYPLPRLKMTGRAWVHRDLPEYLPQFFVSELHVEQFDASFEAAAKRVFGNSRDPLDAFTCAALENLQDGRGLPIEVAVTALEAVVGAFDCQHAIPDKADYKLLLGQSAEAAWIATEGNAFNHATSRVADIDAEAERQRALGRAIKLQIEVSQNGRVRQTAFRADPVSRTFRLDDRLIEREVPGSFYEIISRERDPATGKLDLTFDSANATGIFQMTRAA